MTTETQYIAQDLQRMVPDQLQLLAVLGNELQSFEEIQAKTGFSSDHLDALLN